MSYSALQELKDEFRKNAFKNKEETIKNAIEMAYADMSRRQEGHTPAMKEVCVKWLENDVFTESLEIKDFPDWHKKTCEALAAELNGIKAGFGTVGRAQKVINMAIKYLSCIRPQQFDGILVHCHMTLDGYTLDWYKSCVRPWAKDNGRPFVEGSIKWSKIPQYDDYMIIQDNIRDYLEQSPEYSIKIGSKETAPILLHNSPFDSEFIIWEGNIIEGKYDSLIKALNNYITERTGELSGRDKDKWLVGTILDEFLRDYCRKI